MGCTRRPLARLHGNFTPAWFSCGPTHCLRRLTVQNRCTLGLMAVREYHYLSLHVVAHRPPHLFHGMVLVALPERGHGAPAAWLGTERMYLSALYCRGIIHRTFFVKEQSCGRSGFCRRNAEREKHALRYVTLDRKHLKTRYDTIQQLCL